jgi:hypothetical protein
MTTSPVKSLIDEEIEDCERRLAIIAFGLPFNEVIGRERGFLVADLPVQLAATMKGRRIAVRERRA